MLKLLRQLEAAEKILILFLLACSILLFFSDRTIRIPFKELQAFPWKPVLGLTLAGIVLKKRREKQLSMGSLLRKILPFLCMVLVYPMIPAFIESLGRPDQDSMLLKLDSILFFGNDPLRLIEPWIHPTLSEWMAFTYSSYGFLLLTLIYWLFLKPDLKPMTHLIFDLTLSLAIGYLGYVLVPAIGPIYSQTYSTPITLTWMKDLKETLMDQPRIERDCFPSLHSALAILMSFHYRKTFRTIFPFVFILLASIPLACVYLRYHYVTDVIAGILLAVTVHGISKTNFK